MLSFLLRPVFRFSSGAEHFFFGVEAPSLDVGFSLADSRHQFIVFGDLQCFQPALILFVAYEDRFRLAVFGDNDLLEEFLGLADKREELVPDCKCLAGTSDV